MSIEFHNSTPWPVYLLGEVSEITLGGTPSTDVADYWGGSIPWMASGEVNKRHIFEVDGRITEIGLASSNATLVDPPAVAIGLAGQGKTRGTAALVHIRVSTNQSIALIKSKSPSLHTNYLFHNLDHRYEELRSRSAGGGRAGLSREILQRVPVALPDPAEQSRIAAVLDTVDEAIAKTEAMIAKLKQVRAGLLHDLLTRGLDENGQLRDPIAHPEQFQDSPIGRIPRGWEITRLGECSSLITSGSRGWAAHYSKDGPIFLRIGNLTREHINLGLDDVVRVQPPAGSEGARTKVKAGDILISITADLGIIGVIPSSFEEAYVNQHIALVRPTQKIVSRWLGRFLASGPSAKQFHMLNDTGAKAGLNLPAVESLLVAVPSLLRCSYNHLIFMNLIFPVGTILDEISP